MCQCANVVNSLWSIVYTLHTPHSILPTIHQSPITQSLITMTFYQKNIPCKNNILQGMKRYSFYKNCDNMLKDRRCAGLIWVVYQYKPKYLH